jgi:hypothetical protein
MKVTELNRTQLKELKERYLINLADENIYDLWMGVDYKGPSWSDLANADKLISDETIFKEFEGINFVEEDFVSRRVRIMGGYDEGRESVQADVQKIVWMIDHACRKDDLNNKSKTELVELLSDVTDSLREICM